MKPCNSKTPVAAVYDRRASPALTERRHRLLSPHRFPKIVCLLLFFSPLFLSAAPKKNTAPPIDPTVVYNADVKVLRGGICEVHLRAISPQGYDVEFKTITESGPRAGSLSAQQRNSKSSVSYFYTHNGKKNSTQDSFRFKARSGPQKAWGYANATIRIEEPPPIFVAAPASLDFGSVFLGESRTLPILIKNSGGGKLRGRFKVGEPWRIADSADLVLAEGESKKILVTFDPVSTDTQRGSLIFESGKKPFPEIALQGMGESRFEAPEKAAFEQRVGAKELRIPVKNRTAEPLSISVHCPAPLEVSDSITLPPESSDELLLTLPARPFAEKIALLTLGDGATTRDIRIHLPPPPTRLEWEIIGKNQLGVVTPGRSVLLSAKLLNTGNSPARGVLRTEGDGFKLAHGQKSAFDIAPGEHFIVQAEWKFPDTLGAAQASFTAETAGLAPLQTAWEADVQLLPSTPPTPTPSPTSTPSPTPTPPPPPDFPPRDPTYRLKPELHWTAFFPSRRTATAIISWSYEGPDPVDFVIQREARQRIDFFNQRVQLPPSLPEKSFELVWTDLPPADAQIQKLSDGRWQAQVPRLRPGYHKIRIIVKRPDSSRMDGVEISPLIGDIPLPQPLPWALPSALVLCAIYLLRQKIRSLFS